MFIYILFPYVRLRLWFIFKSEQMLMNNNLHIFLHPKIGKVFGTVWLGVHIIVFVIHFGHGSRNVLFRCLVCVFAIFSTVMHGYKFESRMLMTLLPPTK